MSRATDQFDAKVKTIIATARAAADQACKQFEGKDEGPCGFGYVVFPPGQRKLINSFKRLNQAEGEDLNRLTGYSLPMVLRHGMVDGGCARMVRQNIRNPFGTRTLMLPKWFVS